jgi:hypothetical protein
MKNNPQWRERFVDFVSVSFKELAEERLLNQPSKTTTDNSILTTGYGYV